MPCRHHRHPDPFMTPKPFPSISVMAVLRIAVMGLLILSCLKVIQPFLGALTWAAIIAISAWPCSPGCGCG
jgi:predicted PurR-regulated permease PerM